MVHWGGPVPLQKVKIRFRLTCCLKPLISYLSDECLPSNSVGVCDAGQFRVRVLETWYSVELRREEDPGEPPGREDKETMGTTSRVGRDWLCVWFGLENACVNVSSQLGLEGTGGIHAQLTHSFHLLNATGDIQTSLHI